MKITSVLYSMIASVGVALAGIMPAQAFSVNFGQTSESSNDPNPPGTSAFVDFMFSDVSGGVQLDLLIENTTGTSTFGAGAIESRLRGITFDLVNNVGIDQGSFSNGGVFGNLLTDVDFNPFSNRPEVGNFDIAFSSSGNFSGGNPNLGLSQGSSTTASVILTTGLGASALEQAFLDGFSNNTLQFGARFQAVNTPTQNDLSDRLLGGTINPEPVPEPFTILGSATALGVGALLKRKAGKKAS